LQIIPTSLDCSVLKFWGDYRQRGKIASDELCWELLVGVFFFCKSSCLIHFEGTYASWFTTQRTEPSSSTPSPLMNAISYVVAALSEPSLCLEAANALRDVCDANRKTLAPHIDAFANIHVGLTDIPVRDIIFLYVLSVS
jgi:hypothetical protein